MSQAARSQPFKIIGEGQGHQWTVLGDHQTIKLTGADTQGRFTLIEQFMEPGTAIPMHVHDFEDEVFQILEGELSCSIGDQLFMLGPGDTVFAPRRVPHGFQVVGDQPARTSLMVFPAGIEDMFELLSQLPAGRPDFNKVMDICGKFGVRFLPPE
ncbi:cupin domain-containing protein [Pontibacter sp. G13]|uniref:cupin domain-containing protein n=1 Tax=Pontibacter sp. G13 TaxID=3074898 RepID=UPI00288B82A6|nr:cupin domain-containing protein [Pontibacter sp. G13]WNJ20268.1 cupin domain-containing protein [Pontibacter sp. G13]